jgi:hypothetical protein
VPLIDPSISSFSAKYPRLSLVLLPLAPLGVAIGHRLVRRSYRVISFLLIVLVLVAEDSRGNLGERRNGWGTEILVTQKELLVHCPGNVGQDACPIHSNPTVDSNCSVNCTPPLRQGTKARRMLTC